jgi:lipopolysaccharide biosynthesis glycosyltransferase
MTSAQDRFSVAFAADPTFSLPLGVAIASLASHYDGPVAIVQSGFEPSARQLIQRAAGRLEVRCVDVSPHDAARFPTGNLDRSTWFRILLPRLLHDCDRIVYLDADVLVRQDIAPLLGADLHGHTIGAVRNLRAPFVSDVDGLTAWQELGLAADLSYFNAGVLVIDAARWRADDDETRVMALADRLARRGLLPMNDQDALNARFAGEWHQLDYKWNQHPLAYDSAGFHHRDLSTVDLERLRDNPAVVHFIGRSKPWHAPCRHPFTDEWRRTAAERVDPAFRPERRSLARRVLSRVQGAGRLLAGRPHQS